MISQTNQDAGGAAEPRSDAHSADQPLTSGENVAKEALRSMQPERTAPIRLPKDVRAADAQAIEAHAERRGKLAARIRLEDPARSEEEVEARLEQFGA